MDLLPCGHISHSEAEEQRWISLAFDAETQRQRALCEKLLDDLRKKKVDPGPYRPYPNTYEGQRIYDIRQHFALLQRRLRQEKYLAQVEHYERALNEILAQPPCRRDLVGVPLVPSRVPGILRQADLATPRTGGRRQS